MLKRRTTSHPFSARTKNIARSKFFALVFALLATPLLAATPAPAVAPSPPPLADLLRAVGSALRAPGAADDTHAEIEGSIIGEKLTGSFHTWRNGERERDDQELGLRVERTLRIGRRIWVQNENGNVRELRGVLLRRSLTDAFIDTGRFADAPERAKYLGTTTIAGRPVFRIEVSAPGGEPETLFVDAVRALPVRLEYIENDGPMTVDFADWRVVNGHQYPFKATLSNGEHAFDIVQLTKRIALGATVPDDVFVPFVARVVDAGPPQTLLLGEKDGHIFCTARIGARALRLLVDTGAQSVVLDTRVAAELGLRGQGSMQAYGAARTGGVGLVRVADVQIGDAHLRDVIVSTIDLVPSSHGSLRFDGILGSPFFASALVEIDVANKTMRFGAPGSFAPAGTRLDLEMDRAVPEASLTLNRTRRGQFLIDTGNNSDLLLYRPYVDANPGVVPFTGDARTSYGIGGTTASYRTFVEDLSFGDASLYNVPTDVVLSTRGAFADRFQAGNVGLGVLKRFVVTFDEGNAALYVARGSQFNDGRERPIAPDLGTPRQHRIYAELTPGL